MNNESPLISIIVPIYNIENYLEKCIESILNQTYKNIEIILVDDGSTDSSPSICDKYVGIDKRIKVIHKENGGLSDARNKGVKYAKGEYIGFVDGDDYICKDMYKKMISLLIENNADLAICNFELVDESYEIIDALNPSIIKNEILDKNDMYKKLSEPINVYYVTAVNKLYKKKIFEDLSFETGRIHEDEFIIHHIINRCDVIVTTEDRLYYYIQRDGSITNSTFSIKRTDGIYALLDRYHFFLSINERDYAFETLRKAYGMFIFTLSKLRIKENKDVLFPIYKELKKSLKYNLRLVKLIMIYNKRKLREFIGEIVFKRNYHAKVRKTGNNSKIFIMATPTHGNLGDHAIVEGEYRFLKNTYTNKPIIEINNEDYLRYFNIVEKRITENDIIIIDGGGNMGTLWPHEDDKISDIINRFQNNRIIVFPQTCYYKMDVSGKERITKNRKVYEKCNNLIIMIRDSSYYKAKEYFPNTKLCFVPDIVLSISDIENITKREGVTFCFRNDREKTILNESIDLLSQSIVNKGILINESTTVIDKRVDENNREEELKSKWREFGSSRLIITDRLHGMIFAAITGTPCLALDNSSKKVSGVYNLWMKSLDYIKCVDSIEDVIFHFDEFYNKEKCVYSLDVINDYYGEVMEMIHERD